MKAHKSYRGLPRSKWNQLPSCAIANTLPEILCLSREFFNDERNALQNVLHRSWEVR
ncbi:hypothetical protein PITC_072840 [Penicillium italicum]|uniref:Uncharacterized protein n=1 Tax=Penicillium italicum TaxID=40296 RepID=A0A0A2KL95_PENIT|nr:hypothetical protein PITC_072840 [Penicillium italicum]